MKKLILPALALIVLASCSKSDEQKNTLVPIELGAGVNSVAVKSPIVSGSITTGIAGWEAMGAIDYSVAETWKTTITAEVSPTANAVTWGTPKFYNADKDYVTFIKAWYPEGTLTAGEVAFPNTDGSVDAMLAAQVSGSKDYPITAMLEFKHKTAQIKFEVVAGEGLDANTEIKSITMKEVELPIGFDLTTDAVKYGAKADLSVASIAANQVIGSSAAAVGNPIMVKSITGKTFKVDVETNKASFLGKTVTVSTENVEAGTAYKITLKFGQTDLELKATIADWVEATGEGEII